ncbi:MAG: MFS family permease [Verrucomicrobiales bacterium]|jgi:MFS family permease
MADARAITRRTFHLDLARAVPLGIIETLFQTFAVLVLIKYFESGQMTKASLIALSKLGLIGSFAIVPLLRFLGWRVTSLSGALNLASTVGIAAAALARSETTFIAALVLAAIAFMLQIPLLTHVYRANYPTERRGQLFGFSATLRGVAAALFALWAGRYLEADISSYQPMMWLFVICGLISSYTLFNTPSPAPPAGGVRLFDAFGWLKRDRIFRNLICCWFLLGLANLTGVALHIEWLANPKTGLGYDEFTVSFIGVTVFVTAKLSSTFLWARWFDRIDFFLLRLLLNVTFAIATLLIFTTHNIWVIGCGFAMQGFAFAGGNIAWSLWVTKIAPEEHVAEYMSVHTFTTGVRGVIAPFLGFWLITVTSPAIIGIGAAAMMLLSSIFILPQVRLRSRRES